MAWINWRERLCYNFAARRGAKTGKPFDLMVGYEDEPHYHRWHLYECSLFPRLLRRFFYVPKENENPTWFKIYLHHFIGDDPGKELHDHRYWNITLTFMNGYIEKQFNSDPRTYSAGTLPSIKTIYRHQGRLYVRRPETAHRIELYRHADGSVVDAWSIFICGPHLRNWGFWCLRGWRRQQDFVHPEHYGMRGRGCE